ncbi:MAG TPA: hypothetical protein VFD58_31155 [Blastocatellia bacterium]|nr:hypothetical protein [Blastocatellia bacterium]
MYIGHAKLEQLVGKLRPDQTLCFALLEERIPGNDGIDLFRMELWVQAGVRDGPEQDVFYWKLCIGQIIAPGGEPWPEELARIRSTGDSALEAVRQYLRGRQNVGTVEESVVIAMPGDLRLLDGTARCLTFDQISQKFSLTESEKPDAPAFQ